MIVYGFRNFSYKLIGGSYERLPLRGAQKISVAPQSSQRTVNVRTSSGVMVPYTEQIETGKQATVEITYLPISFLTDVLGYSYENGILSEPYRFRSAHFSLYYEQQTNEGPIRTQLFNCACTKPSFDVTTISDQLSADTKKLTLILNPELNTYNPSEPFGNYSRSTTKAANPTAFDTWFEQLSSEVTP